MIPNYKPALFLLCAAFCVLPGAWAQTASTLLPIQPDTAKPASSAATPSGKVRVQPQLADSIVAVVNDEVITRNDLAEKVAAVVHNLKAQNVALPPPSELRRQVLEHMIIDRAQVQLAKEDGLRVDDLTLDRYISRAAEANKLTMQQFRDQVEQDGTPFNKFRETWRDEILIQRVREHEVNNKLQITEAEVDNFLAAQKGLESAQQELDLAQILIGIPENATAEQIASRRAKAEDILKQLKDGADFAKLAASYSDASEALQGGDLGWRNQDHLPQLFFDAVANLNQGDISGIVKSANGFHILKLIGKRAASVMRGNGQNGPQTVQQTHVRHILIKVNQVVTAAEANRKLLELKERLNNKAATFEDLAKLYSNDLSASKGGDLGWVYPGDTAPEFEKAMNALQPGQVSDPVQTPFGLHLIEVVERKSDDVSKERQRQLARQAIREGKLDEATQDWIRTLRDRAYVEYRQDEN